MTTMNTWLNANLGDFIKNLRSNQPKPVVVIVDDETGILNALKRLLRKENYELVTYANPQEALEYITQHAVHAVISDMRMPIMTGAELLTQIYLKQPKTQRLLMTGYADFNSTISAINQGKIHGYIAKPWVDHDFIETIAQCVERFRLVQERDQLLGLVNQQNQQLKRYAEQREAELSQTSQFLDHEHDESEADHHIHIEQWHQWQAAACPALADHAQQVRQFADQFAERIELPHGLRIQLGWAAVLHDLGRLLIPHQHPDSPEFCVYANMPLPQRQLFHHHIDSTLTLFAQCEWLNPALEMIRYHHTAYETMVTKIESSDLQMASSILALCEDIDELHRGWKIPTALSYAEIRVRLSHNTQQYHPRLCHLLPEILQPLN
jgi:response regulator RpfG family c-di-GMP phosphodiesterase